MARKKSTTKQVGPAPSSAPDVEAAIGAAAIESGSGAEATAGPPGASEGAGAEATARPRSAFASGGGAEATAGPSSDKAELVAELIAQLGDALAAAQRAHAAAIEGATHTEARAENPKDTRGLEQSYLARGQAQRVAELEAGLAAVSAFAVRSFGPSAPIAL